MSIILNQDVLAIITDFSPLVKGKLSLTSRENSVNIDQAITQYLKSLFPENFDITSLPFVYSSLERYAPNNKLSNKKIVQILTSNFKILAEKLIKDEKQNPEIKEVSIFTWIIQKILPPAPSAPAPKAAPAPHESKNPLEELKQIINTSEIDFNLFHSSPGFVAWLLLNMTGKKAQILIASSRQVLKIVHTNLLKEIVKHLSDDAVKSLILAEIASRPVWRIAP